MVAHGFERNAANYDIRPDAIEKFGYLSEILQVQASVVLADMFRRGIRVDLEAARKLEEQYRAALTECIETLKADYPDVLTHHRDGTLKLTEKGQTPSLSKKKL